MDALLQHCWPRPRGRRIRSLRPCPSSTNRSVGNPPAAPRCAPLPILPGSGFSALRVETLSGRGRAGQFCATCVQPFRRVGNRSGLFGSIAERLARSKRVLSRSRRYAQSESARHQAQAAGPSPHTRTLRKPTQRPAHRHVFDARSERSYPTTTSRHPTTASRPTRGKLRETVTASARDPCLHQAKWNPGSDGSAAAVRRPPGEVRARRSRRPARPPDRRTAGARTVAIVGTGCRLPGGITDTDGL